MSEIFVNEPEAFTAEFEEFNQAIAEIDADPVQALRDWYIAKGEWEECKIAFPDWCKD